MPNISRRSEASLPNSTAVCFCISLSGQIAALRVGLEVDRPTLSHHPFIHFHALDEAEADPPLGIFGIRSLIVTANGALADPLDQRIACCETALPLLVLFIHAELVELRRIDAVQPECGVAKLQRIAIFNDDALGSLDRGDQNQT